MYQFSITFFQTYAVVMHTPDLCNKIAKVTADDREIEVIEKGNKKYKNVSRVERKTGVSQMVVFPPNLISSP